MRFILQGGINLHIDRGTPRIIRSLSIAILIFTFFRSLLKDRQLKALTMP